MRRQVLRGLVVLTLVLLIGFGCFLAGSNLWAWYQFNAAERALDFGAYQEAEQHLDSCLTFWSGNGQVHYWMARAARSLGKYDKAKQHLEKCEELHWSPEAIEVEEKLLRAQQGEFAEVEKDLLSYAETNDNQDMAPLLEVLAHQYARNSQIAAAVHWGQRFLKYAPKNVNALLAMARIQEATHNTTDALAYYQRAVALQPDNDFAREALAKALLVFNQPQKAIVQYQELKSRGAKSKAILLGLAQAHRALGQKEEAAALLEQLAADYPTAWDVWSERGKLAFDNGHLNQAERCLRKADALHPNDATTLYKLYLCLRQQSRAKRREAEIISARYRRVLDDLKRLDELVIRGAADRPNDAGIHFEVATILLRLGEEKAGVHWLRKTLEIRPYHRGALQALAKYYQKTGKKDLATRHLQALP
jgi:tetratricopeptide (TPR) repeat protein